jgi:hypothetical protein
MVLIGPTSSSVDFSPQGLLEKVFTPLVVHSQICPPDTSGATAACVCGGADGAAEFGSAADESAVDSGAAEGAGKVVVAGAACAATTCGATTGSALCVEAAAKATAMAAADRPPKIQGSKSRSLFIRRLSSAA